MMRLLSLPILLLTLHLTPVVAQTSVLSTGEWYKIAVTEDGVYALDKAFLLAHGIDVSAIDPRTIRIFGNGGSMLPEANSLYRPDDLIENAITVTGEADGSFDSNDRVLFYGQSPHRWADATDASCGHYRHQKHLYSDTTYYFLNFGIQNGIRISLRGSLSAQADEVVTVFEDRQFHESDSVNLFHSGKEWFGERFDPSTPSRSFSFHFPHRKDNMPITVRTDMAAACLTSATDVVISVNDVQIGGLYIPQVVSYSEAAKTASVCDRIFTTSNTVNINLTPLASDPAAIAWLNSLEVTAYRRLIQSGDQMHFAVTDTSSGQVSEVRLTGATDVARIWDITDPLHPIRQAFNLSADTLRFRFHSDSSRHFISFTGSEYLTPPAAYAVPNQNLHGSSPKNLLIITPKELAPEAYRLAQHHQDLDGLSTSVVRLDKIYNEFSSGAKDISAIRDFIRFLYERPNGPAVMRYVLLFGDGSYDPKNRIPQNRDLVPTYQSVNSLYLTITHTSDDFYCLLDSTEGGTGGTPLIDLALGRMPANTLDEARIMVDKVIHYTTSPSTLGPWRANTSFVAEDGDQDMWAKHMDYFAQFLDTTYCSFVGQKIFLGAFQQPIVNGAETCPIAHDSLVSAFDDNLILGINVMGKNLWLTHERILDSTDVVSMTNINALPFILMPHNDGIPMDDPNRTVLSEYMVRDPEGGAIAFYAPSRITYLAPNFTTATEFFVNAYEKVNGEYPRLGDLVYHMKTLYSTPNERSKALLGDPALRLNYPENNVDISLPGTTVNADGNYELTPNMPVQVACEVTDAAGTPLIGFNGTATLMLDAKRNEETLLTAYDYGYDFEQYHPVSRATTAVVNGTCSFNLVMPDTMDVTTNTKGRLRVYVQSADTDGLGSSCKITFKDFFDSVNDHTEGANSMSVWPNPASDAINIRLTDGVSGSIQVLDLYGRIVIQTDHVPGRPIGISSLSSGVYLIRFAGKDYSATGRVVVTRDL